MNTYDKIYKLLEGEGLINKQLTQGCILDGLEGRCIFNGYDCGKLCCYSITDERNVEFYHGFVIIGHPPTILDILRWFKKVRKNNFAYYIDEDGMLMEGDEYIGIEFDLSKPLLKDQREDVLISLFNLMNEIGQ